MVEADWAAGAAEGGGDSQAAHQAPVLSGEVVASPSEKIGVRVRYRGLSAAFSFLHPVVPKPPPTSKQAKVSGISRKQPALWVSAELPTWARNVFYEKHSRKNAICQCVASITCSASITLHHLF